jgi:hypothetical protein
MSYQVVLTEDPSQPQGKAFGKNVFIDDVPENCKIYLFYYPGAVVNPALETALRKLGEAAGNNLFVDIGRLDDPLHDKIVSRFDIKPYPVIIITADSTLACPEGTYASAFVRLDSKSLLNSPERTVSCVQEVFNLFLTGEIAEAMARVKWTQRAELLKPVGHFIVQAVKGVLDFIKETEISFSLAEGKLDLKHR